MHRGGGNCWADGLYNLKATYSFYNETGALKPKWLRCNGAGIKGQTMTREREREGTGSSWMLGVASNNGADEIDDGRN